MGRPSKHSAEVRERAVRLVFEQTESHGSQWAAIVAIAPKLDCTPETLRRWVRQAERDAGGRPGLTTSEAFDYIEIFYNQQRRHSALAYLSPADYERSARMATQAA